MLLDLAGTGAAATTAPPRGRARLPPAVALIDIGMPQLNGYEIAARVRAVPWAATLTLIALTGWGQDSDRARALTAGFDEHWVKPIAPETAIEFCAAAARRRSETHGA